MTDSQSSGSYHNTRENRTKEIVEELLSQRLASVGEQAHSHPTSTMELHNKPAVFCSDSMDASLWLHQYKDFTKSRNLTDDQFVSLFASCLKQKSQMWFYNLSDQQKCNPTVLCESFLTRFQPLQNYSLSSFFNRRQTSTESVEDFIDEKIHLANQAKVAEETAVWHTVDSMLPHAKQYVFDKVRQKTFSEIREHAKMAESVLSVVKVSTACAVCPTCSSSREEQSVQDAEVNRVNANHTRPYQGTFKAETSHQRQHWPQSGQPLTSPDSRHRPIMQHVQRFPPCASCGKNTHRRTDCSVFQRQVQCHFCNKLGHLENVCRTKARSSSNY